MLLSESRQTMWFCVSFLCGFFLLFISSNCAAVNRTHERSFKQKNISETAGVDDCKLVESKLIEVTQKKGGGFRKVM